MRNPDRIPKILAEICQIWQRQPDMRLGQLIVAANKNRDPFYIEDEELVRAMKAVVGSRRQPERPTLPSNYDDGDWRGTIKDEDY